MIVYKSICVLFVLVASLSSWTPAQALSLDGNCSNWKVGTLTDSSGTNRGGRAKSICAALGKSGDSITVFDDRNQMCLLCSRDDWTPGSSSSSENSTRADTAKTVEVPDVVGLLYRDALTKLKEAGLKPRVGKTSSPLTLNPRQKVLSQETTAGARVSRGETVVINFSKEGFKMPLTLSNPNNKNRPLPDVLTREQYNKVHMPNVVGMNYDQAASKLKSVGLKPVYRLGISPPDKKHTKTVMSTSAKANASINLGTEIIVTVYDSYRDPDQIVKRDPASAFGGKPPSESPEAANTDWAGMWDVIGKYNMELHVSGNKVTGRYGPNMDRTIEGTISGNILTGWWREKKSHGRFKNTISDDGNSWSGKWNIMKETLGGWNGGWEAKRIGEKKPSEKTVKRDPASTFGGQGLNMKTAGSCQQLPTPPSHMRNPTCQCSEANALFGTTSFTTCYWVDK